MDLSFSSLAVSTTVFSLFLAVAPAAFADVPMGPYPDCGTGGACPSDYDPNGEWYLGSGVPPDISPASLPENERDLGSGNWVDRAWGTTVGRTDVTIAVLDSGIQWSQRELLNKHRINTGELPDAAASDDPNCVPVAQRFDLFDCNGDSVVNMEDWANDSRILPDMGENADGHADDIKDPSDLIAVWSDGVDDDGNGYIDDICGWDFFWNDNNPYDEALKDGYSHGSKEGRWSVGEGDGGGGSIGSCPNCMVVFMRVSDSFIADANNFAEAVQYAVDNDVQVIQNALGALNNTQAAVDAIEYAWDNGVTMIASAADETSWHANFPSANHHTIYVHAIRHDSTDFANSRSFFAFSNCTNYGGRLQLSIAAEACSSGAVGVGAGIAGLAYSAMKDALEDGTLSSPLTSNEIYQLMRWSVHDVAFNPDDDDDRRYPSRVGWDAWFGYGRTNADQLVRRVRSADVPPEADILSPDWFVPHDPERTPTIEVTGLASSRLADFEWELQVGPGMDPLEEEFKVVATGSGGVGNPTTGVLGTVSLVGILDDPSAPMGLYGRADTNVSKTWKVHAPAVTLRLRVTDADGRLGEMRKMIYVRTDPDMLPGFPKKLANSLESSPNVTDVDGDGIDDLVIATGEGEVMVLDGTGAMKPGWPQKVALLDEVDPGHLGNHLQSDAYTSGAVTADRRHAILSSPAVGDLDGDGTAEIVVGTYNGDLWVFEHDGTVREGWPFSLDESLVVGVNDSENSFDYGFFSSPALGDLDGDGDLEIVIGGLDGRVYAFHDDGTFSAGFPLVLRTEYVDRGETTSRGERIISSPAIGDIDGDGHPEIVIGTNQKTTGTYGLGYAISHEGVIEDGWPAYLFGAYTNALPIVGEGIPGSPALCDLDGDGTMEVAMHTIADAGVILDHDGQKGIDESGYPYARLARVATEFGTGTNSSEAGANLIMINSGAFGDMDQDGQIDYLVGAMGFEYANGLAHDGRRTDHDHLLSGWSGAPQDSTVGPKMPYLEYFPRIMEDLQFFLNSTIVDINDDGFPEAINGSAGGILHAFDYLGREPAGWPKHLGQWILGTPVVGDIDGDGYLDVIAGTRSGWLYAWKTPALAEGSMRLWNGFHHDPWNSGDCSRPLREYPPIEEEGCADCESSIAAGSGGWLVLAFIGLGVRRRRR
jgi:hypothetical protein